MDSKKISWSVGIVLIFLVNLSQAGYAGMFADIGYGARPAGLGDAFVALSDDANAILWNSAGLAYLEKRTATFMHTSIFGLVPYHFLAYAFPSRENTGLGLGIIFSGDAALRETSLIGSYGQKINYLVKRLLKKELPEKLVLSGGGTFKVRIATVGNNEETDPNKSTGRAFGFGFDLGLLLHWGEKWSFGLNLKEVLSPMFCRSNIKGSYVEFVPFSHNLGAKYQLRKNLLVSLQLNDFRWFLLGGEWNFHKFVAGRMGIKQIAQGKYSRQIFCFGGSVKCPLKFGEKPAQLHLDLAYIIDWKLKNTLKISFDLLF